MACRAFLLAAAAMVLAAASPGGAPQSVAFPSNDADLTGRGPTRLTASLYQPAGAGPHPAIVLRHGCGGLARKDGRLTARHADWAQRFQSQGYVVLLVDSFGPRGVREVCTVPGRTVRARAERPRDAYGALAYLHSLPFVRADRIGLMGWSNGSSTTPWTVAVASPARPASLPGGDFRAAVAFYPGCRVVLESRERWTTRIPPHVLIGAADDWTPASFCEALVVREHAAGAPVGITVYPGAHHDFDAPSTKPRVRQNIATTASGTATVDTHPQAQSRHRAGDGLLRADAEGVVPPRH